MQGKTDPALPNIDGDWSQKGSDVKDHAKTAGDS